MELYLERHGTPRAGTPPLLLIHGGGSTIATNWAALLPVVSGGREVLAVELQGHGHSPDDGTPTTFEKSADDVEAALDRAGVGAVDVLGFSNGGNVAMRLAVRHPDRVRRQIAASAFYRRAGMVDGFWDGLQSATADSMPEVYHLADRELHPDRAHQQRLFDLDSQQMLGFVDWDAADLTAMRTPTLFVVADRDVVRVDHTVAMAGLVPGARLLVVPGTHGDYLGELLAAGGDLGAMHAAVPLLLRFLDGAFDEPADGAGQPGSVSE